jgi:sugar lactone lactonase YvrE
VLRELLATALVIAFYPQLPTSDLPPELREQAVDIEKARQQYPDNPCILYQVAAIYARAHRPDDALTALREMASKHAGLDPRLRDGFQSLAGNPEFLRLKQEIRRDNPPVRNAQPAFTIAESDLIPEGIAWSEKQKRFYLGSMKRKIIEVDAAGHARDFVAPADNGLGIVVGLRVDDKRGELWAASEQMAPHPGLVRGIFRYRLRDRKLLASYPVKDGEADLVNDLVVAPDGTLYATATNSGSLVSIRPGSATAEIFFPPHSLPDPNGITASRDGRFLFVAGWYGITRIDLRTKQKQLLKSSPQIAAGCFDGLYEYHGDLVGIQNCVHDTGRVLRLHLNSARDTILSARVLESYNPLFDAVTTGAIAGHRFYFMANTQIHKIGPDGSVPAGVWFNPIHVLRLDLNHGPTRSEPHTWNRTPAEPHSTPRPAILSAVRRQPNAVESLP